MSKLSHPDPQKFQSSINEAKTALYLLSNTSGVSLTICNYGGRIVSLHTPDKKGTMGDIVCGFNSLQEYINAKEQYHGALIGRYANRIADAKFSIDGTKYSLTVNNGPNSLHGGPKGFHNQVWEVIEHSSSAIKLRYISYDMEEGFPGTLTTVVNYELNNNNELIITYTASTDKKTVINLTNHAYFNLAGEGNGDILQHEVIINSSHITEVNEYCIPTGHHAKVDNIPFDFRKPKTIAKDLNKEHLQLKNGNGYDHNFLIDNAEPGVLSFAAQATEPLSGRKMTVYTTEPSIQFYIGNFFDGSDIGKSGGPYKKRCSFAFETQHYPDSPNHPHFPTTVLKPGEKFHSKTIYKFGIS